MSILPATQSVADRGSSVETVAMGQRTHVDGAAADGGGGSFADVIGAARQAARSDPKVGRRDRPSAPSRPARSSQRPRAGATHAGDADAPSTTFARARPGELAGVTLPATAGASTSKAAPRAPAAPNRPASADDNARAGSAASPSRPPAPSDPAIGANPAPLANRAAVPSSADSNLPTTAGEPPVPAPRLAGAATGDRATPAPTSPTTAESDAAPIASTHDGSTTAPSVARDARGGDTDAPTAAGRRDQRPGASPDPSNPDPSNPALTTDHAAQLRGPAMVHDDRRLAESAAADPMRVERPILADRSEAGRRSGVTTVSPAPPAGSARGTAMDGLAHGADPATAAGGRSSSTGSAPDLHGQDASDREITLAAMPGRATSRRSGSDQVAGEDAADPTAARAAGVETNAGASAGAGRAAVHGAQRATEAVALAADRPVAEAADRIIGQVVDRLRSFSTDGTPGLETRFDDPQLGSLRLVVSGRAGETVQAELVAGDARSAEAIGRAVERAVASSAGLHGIALQVRTGDTSGSGPNGHSSPRRDGGPRDETGHRFEDRAGAQAGDPGRRGRGDDPAFARLSAVEPVAAPRRRSSPSVRPPSAGALGRPTGRPGVDVRA